jgi:hypothetical protein
MESSSCTPCPAGTYEMNKVCLACPPNFFSEAGSSSCTWCGSGSISTLGSAMCFKCDAGSYWLPGDPSSLLQPSSSVDIADLGLWSSGSLQMGRNGLAATSLPSENLAFFAGGYGIHGNPIHPRLILINSFISHNYIVFVCRHSTNRRYFCSCRHIQRIDWCMDRSVSECCSRLSHRHISS